MMFPETLVLDSGNSWTLKLNFFYRCKLVLKINKDDLTESAKVISFKILNFLFHTFYL